MQTAEKALEKVVPKPESDPTIRAYSDMWKTISVVGSYRPLSGQSLHEILRYRTAMVRTMLRRE
jgi:hypothetical protein